MDSQTKPLPGLVRDEPELRRSVRQHIGYALMALEEMQEAGVEFGFHDKADQEALEIILSERAIREGVSHE